MVTVQHALVYFLVHLETINCQPKLSLGLHPHVVGKDGEPISTLQDLQISTISRTF